MPAKEGEEENPELVDHGGHGKRRPRGRSEQYSLDLVIQRLLTAQWVSFHWGDINTEDREVGQK